MRVVHIQQNTPEWLEARRTSIGGSDLKDIATERGNGVKIGIYKLIAERLAVEDDGTEAPTDRGHRLEPEALATASEQLGIEFINGDCMWVSDDDPDMHVSPDGHSDDNTIAAEVKCLGAANHLEAIIDFKASVAGKANVLKDEIPSGYRHQVIQYFIINETLETLFFILYNPLVKSLPLHIIRVDREDVAGEVDYYKQFERETLNGVRTICERLTF